MTKIEKPLIKFVNLETGEEIEREMNDEEYSQYMVDLEEDKKIKEQVRIKAEKKSALLEKLGITEEEANILLS